MPLFSGITLPGCPDLNNVRKLDLLPLGMTRRMHRVGMAIDPDYFNELTLKFNREADELEKDIASYVPPDRLHEFSDKSAEVEEASNYGEAGINADSAEQIGRLLFDVLGVGLGMKLKTTAKGKPSTGKKQLELLQSQHPVIRKILDYRERRKLVSTYTSALVAKARFHPRSKSSVDTCPVCELRHAADSWRVHGEVGTTRAETGRFNHKNPNLANIPLRTANGGLVRAGFVAPEGSVLVSRDLSQIELRGLAHCANAASMIKVYEEGKDIHVFTACAAFGIDYEWMAGLLRLEKKSPERLTDNQKQEILDFKLFKRLPSKNLNFMIVYGATVIGLLAQLALSGLIWTEAEGEAFIDRWFNLYPEVREYMDKLYYRARRYGLVWDEFGRVRLVPEVRSCHSWIRQAGLRQAGNMPIQSLAAGQMKLAMGRVEGVLKQLWADGKGMWCWPLMTIHDQLIVEAEEDVASEVQESLEWAMDGCMDDVETGRRMFRVPVRSDGEEMQRWKKAA